MTIEDIAESVTRMLNADKKAQSKVNPHGQSWFYYEGRKDVENFILELAKIHKENGGL